MVSMHRAFVHIQRRTARDLYGLIVGRVIDTDSVATGAERRMVLRSRDRFSTVLRLHIGGFGVLYVHAKCLPYR